MDEKMTRLEWQLEVAETIRGVGRGVIIAFVVSIMLFVSLAISTCESQKKTDARLTALESPRAEAKP